MTKPKTLDEILEGIVGQDLMIAVKGDRIGHFGRIIEPTRLEMKYKLNQTFTKILKDVIGRNEKEPPNIKENIGWGENITKMEYPDTVGRARVRGYNQAKAEIRKKAKKEWGVDLDEKD